MKVIKFLMNRLELLNALNNRGFHQLFIDSSKTELTKKQNQNQTHWVSREIYFYASAFVASWNLGMFPWECFKVYQNISE